MKNIITYNLGKLGKFLMGREDGENAYYVIKRDVFDELKPDEIVKFTLVGQVIMNPSFADETIARCMQEYPGKVFMDIMVGPGVKKVLETIELTTGLKIEYI